MSHWHSAAIIADEIWMENADSNPKTWGVHRAQYATGLQAMSIESVCMSIYGTTRNICLLGGYDGNPQAVVIMSSDHVGENDNHAWIVAPVMCKEECEYQWI